MSELLVVNGSQGKTTDSLGTEWVDCIDPKLVANYENTYSCNIKQACEDELLASARWSRFSTITMWYKGLLIWLYLVWAALLYLFLRSLLKDGAWHQKTTETHAWALLAAIAFILLLHLIYGHIKDKKLKAKDEMDDNALVRKQMQLGLVYLGAFTRHLMSEDLYWYHNELFGSEHALDLIARVRAEKASLLRLIAHVVECPDLDETTRDDLQERLECLSTRLEMALKQIELFGIKDEKDPDLSQCITAAESAT